MSGFASREQGEGEEEEKARKWACKRCTYENWPKASKCTLCYQAKAKGPLIITASHGHNEDRDIYKMASLLEEQETSPETKKIGPKVNISVTGSSNKWSCSLCTYSNWPKALKCTQCQTPRKRSSPNRSSSPALSLDPPTHTSPTLAAQARPDFSCISSSASSDNYYNDKNKSAAHGTTLQKWSCAACTYENWPKAWKCILCATPKSRGSENSAAALQPLSLGGTGTGIASDERRTNTPSPPGAQGASKQSLRNNRNLESPDSVADAAHYPTNNYLEEIRLRQLRNRAREADWLWLDACAAVVDGDPEPVLQYLSTGGDPNRELTTSEVALLARPAAFDMGLNLFHLAIRFERNELALLLANSSRPVAKRVPSDVSRDTANEIRRHLSTCIRQRKGDFPCYFVSEFVTFALPGEIEELAPSVQERLFDELLDRDVQKELEEESPIINWSMELTERLGSRLHALWNRSTGDCLLDSALQATWGIFDKENALRRALADSLSEATSVLFPRFKEAEALHANLLQFTLDQDQWEEDWAVILSLATQPGSALEQFHIFTLAHVLRRPIIVYGVKYVKSFRGETLGYAGYEGIYLPLLWEATFCWKSPIALAYTRGHFSALVPMEPESGDAHVGAGANLRGSEDSVVYLPLVTSEHQLLPLHFLSRNELGREEEIMRQWLDCCVTEGGTLVAKQKLAKKPLLVAQMVDEWVDFYRNAVVPNPAAISHTVNASTAHDYSSDGDSD